MKMNLPLMIPSLKEEDIDSAVAVLRSLMLVQGKKVAELERLVAEKLHAKYAIAASNGTSTLHMALIALGIGPGDEVILPAYTFVATANVVELVGARPVFIDIDLRDFNIKADAIEAAISSKTKAILTVHEFGQTCDINRIKKIAIKNKIFLIEDAACALGAKYNDTYAGTFGDFGSFSFHPRKAITSGEGGVLVTNDAMLAQKVKILRNHGMSRVNSKIDVVEAGFNYRMTDFQAAMVCSALKRLDSIIETKQTLAEFYLTNLQHSLIKLPCIEKDKKHTWQTFHIMLDPTIDRDKVIKDMKMRGIETNYGAQCIPELTYYKNKYNLNTPYLYPNAMIASKQGLALPMYESLSKEQIIRIIESLTHSILEQC